MLLPDSGSAAPATDTQVRQAQAAPEMYWLVTNALYRGIPELEFWLGKEWIARAAAVVAQIEARST